MAAEKIPKPEPTFFRILLDSIIPLAIAVLVAAVGGFLIYLFWFGTDWIFK